MTDGPSPSNSTAPLESEEEVEERDVRSRQRSRQKTNRSNRSNSIRSPKVEPEPEPMGSMEIEETSTYDLGERQPPSRPITQQEENTLLPKNWSTWFLVALVIIVVLLIIILVPLGYNELEYYEMGFYHNTATGFVDTTKVYVGGRHWVGVSGSFIAYPSTAIREVYKNISIFNQERIEVTLTFSFTYQLRSDELNMLHETYGEHYQPIIRSASLAAVKGAAAVYTVHQFRRARPEVSKGLREAVSTTIAGKCCRIDCSKLQCPTDCVKYCNKNKDMGYYSKLRHFQLHRVYIAESLTKQLLDQVIEQEMEDTFRLQQEEKLVHLQTEQLELEYSNDAAQITRNATAESSKRKLAALAEADSVIEYYRNQGLRLVYETLNVTEEEYKKSLDYVITLRNQNKANLYLGFEYVVANP